MINHLNDDILDPNLLMANVSAKPTVGDDDDALYTHPYTAYDVKEALSMLNVKSNEICGALKITSNQWATMTRICKDGRDMDYEFVAPSLEIFIRLAQRFPQHAPWNRVSTTELCKKGGWTLEELAFICGVPLSSFERYQKNPKASMTAQTAWLMNFIYVLLKENIAPDTIKRIAEDMYTYRNDLPVTKMTTPSSWSSVEDQDYRKVRKTIRTNLNALLIDGKDAITETDLNKIISSIYRKQTTLDSILKRSKLDDENLSFSIRFTLDKCFQWLESRKARLVLHTQLMRMPEGADKEAVKLSLRDVEVEYRLISKDLERLANIEMGTA